MTSAKRFLAPLLVIIALVLLPTKAFSDDSADKIAAYMDRLNSAGFHGSVIVCQGDDTIIAQGYGMANREHDIPNKPETKFRIGSITKQFTAMAIMILDEQKKLSIDDPVSNHIDDSPDAWEPITVHHLLTHTSGIPSFTGMKEYRPNMMLPQSTEQMIARFKDKPLLFAPGEKFDYSNSGYYLLGAIIEKASGKTFERFLRDEILEPLELSDTGYDRYQTILKNRASGYTRWTSNVAHDVYIDMTQPYSAGAMYSTVEDLGRWDRALRRGDLISAKSYDRMYTPFKNNYAYGWNVRNRSGKKVISHGGGINGFVSHILRYPDQELCVVVLCNVKPASPQNVAQQLAKIILAEVEDEPTTKDLLPSDSDDSTQAEKSPTN